jgi:predicted ATPase
MSLDGGSSETSWRATAWRCLGWTRQPFCGALSRWQLRTWPRQLLSAGWVFFDRGLIDAAAGLQHLTGEPLLEKLGQSHRYHRRVFLAPPWPEIYRQDAERRHGLDWAIEEYLRLLEVCQSLAYEVSILPKASVAQRVDFVLGMLVE